METVKEEPKTKKEPATEVVANLQKNRNEKTQKKVEVTVQNIEKKI
ncbi:MAG: hypothetical protein CM15mV101_110 [uncultured marine virus]|nr:MAG: hypothetical protein CM15mV101_110 [uncultured marine virus]